LILFAFRLVALGQECGRVEHPASQTYELVDNLSVGCLREVSRRRDTVVQLVEQSPDNSYLLPERNVSQMGAQVSAQRHMGMRIGGRDVGGFSRALRHGTP
jgi:hypothetical protein